MLQVRWPETFRVPVALARRRLAAAAGAAASGAEAAGLSARRPTRCDRSKGAAISLTAVRCLRPLFETSGPRDALARHRAASHYRSLAAECLHLPYVRHNLLGRYFSVPFKRCHFQAPGRSERFEVRQMKLILLSEPIDCRSRSFTWRIDRRGDNQGS